MKWRMLGAAAVVAAVLAGIGGASTARAAVQAKPAAMSTADCEVIISYRVMEGVYSITCNDGVPGSQHIVYDWRQVGPPALGVGTFFTTYDRNEGVFYRTFLDVAGVPYGA